MRRLLPLAVLLLGLTAHAQAVFNSVQVQASSGETGFQCVNQGCVLKFGDDTLKDVSGVLTFNGLGLSAADGGVAIPFPTATKLGGVFSSTAGSHQYMTGIYVDGGSAFANPASADISDATASNTASTLVLRGASGQVAVGRLTADGGVVFGDGTIQNRAAIQGYGVYASLPGAGTAGARYTCTNCPVAQWIDTGSAWAPLIGGQQLGVQPKAASNFGLADGGALNVSLTDVGGSLEFENTSPVGTSGFTGYVESLSSATMYVQASFETFKFISNGGSTAVAMREIASGKIFLCGFVYTSSTNLIRSNYSSISNTSQNSSATLPFTSSPQNTFFRARISGSNVLCEVSADLSAWTTVSTTATTTVFTVAPDQVGFGGSNAGLADMFFAVTSYQSGSL